MATRKMGGGKSIPRYYDYNGEAARMQEEKDMGELNEFVERYKKTGIGEGDILANMQSVMSPEGFTTADGSVMKFSGGKIIREAAPAMAPGGTSAAEGLVSDPPGQVNNPNYTKEGGGQYTDIERAALIAEHNKQVRASRDLDPAMDAINSSKKIYLAQLGALMDSRKDLDPLANAEQITEANKQIDIINTNLDKAMNMAVSRGKELDAIYPMKSMADMAEMMDRGYNIYQGTDDKGNPLFGNISNEKYAEMGVESPYAGGVQEQIAYASQAQAKAAASGKKTPTDLAEAAINQPTPLSPAGAVENTKTIKESPEGKYTEKKEAKSPSEAVGSAIAAPVVGAGKILSTIHKVWTSPTDQASDIIQSTFVDQKPTGKPGDYEKLSTDIENARQKGSITEEEAKELQTIIGNQQSEGGKVAIPEFRRPGTREVRRPGTRGR